MLHSGLRKFLTKAILGNIRLKVGEGVTSRVVEHHSVVALASNAAADSGFKRFQALVEDTYEAFLSVPLITGGDVIGVINVHHREPHNHSSDEIALLTSVGEQIGGAIKKSFLAEENVRLQEETHEMQQQLENTEDCRASKGIPAAPTGTALRKKSRIFACAMKNHVYDGRCGNLPKPSFFPKTSAGKTNDFSNSVSPLRL